MSSFILKPGTTSVSYLTVCFVCAVTQAVEALRYKPEGSGFDSRWSHWDFSFT